MPKIKVFEYIEEYDAFTTTATFVYINAKLGLDEWTPVVWITRLFCMDNDYGEHIFDNWDEREELEKRFDLPPDLADQLLIIVPHRFQDGKDGPCNTDTLRKRFWTDVMISLELDLETMFEKARHNNEMWRKDLEDNQGDYLAYKHFKPDLENTILQLKKFYANSPHDQNIILDNDSTNTDN